MLGASITVSIIEEKDKQELDTKKINNFYSNNIIDLKNEIKKIIIGFLCFIVVSLIALGIYIYMLDWNKHKNLVSERFSQITGLKTLIDGNLKVKLFPTPRFTANKVKFSQSGNFKDPLVIVNEISANVALLPLFHNKFILNSMTLNGAMVNVTKSENGNFNWSGVVTNNKNKSKK